MKTIVKTFFFLSLAILLLASCSHKPEIHFVDKDGNIHLLSREGERTASAGLQKIIAHGLDTVITVDGTGHQKIWTAADVNGIDTTKIRYYLKKKNGDNINIYTPLEDPQDLLDNQG
ncbi:hypothetical protein [Sphingobacterium sp. HMA12]|uniref:hypothetical protein n=1 Tax=Sphingobacterium sp. HMA12 TaxID=2050894 RepID=UPI000CEA189F|nr:hypothetical protein [Sphingobacterium sp. HMA12]